MNNSKTTRRALFSSVIALILCFSMLLGTTFAWFTDEVVSAGNKIVSGTLLVDLLHKSDAAGNENGWVSLKDNASHKVYDYDLWEPGYTQYETLKVVNEGTLALKFKLTATIADETLGTKGERLSDVIDVYIKAGDVTKPASFADVTAANGWTNAGTLTSFLTDADGMAYGVLNETDGNEIAYTIALHMREEAGNEYQNIGLGDLYFNLLATQLTYENDSFDDQYDKEADYDGEIGNAASLAAALASGGTYKVIADIEIPEGEALAVESGKSVALYLEGNDITGSNTKDTGALIVNNGTLSIFGTEDSVISNNVVNGASLIQNDGTLTIDGGKYIGAPIGATGYPAYAIVSPGTLTIEDGIFTTNRGAISTESGGKLVINDGTFTTSNAADGRNMTLHVIYARGTGSEVTINGGYFENNHTSTGGSSVLCPYGGAITVYGGTFRDAMDDTAWTSVGNFQNYMGVSPYPVVYGGNFDDTTFTKHVAEGYAYAQNADGTYTVMEGVAVKNDTELLEAIKDDEKKVVLAAGNYSMPDGSDVSLRGKNLTIVGTKDTVIDVSHVDERDQFVTGADIVFDGVTLNFGKVNYMGFANANNLVYKNCTINGLQFLYGPSVTFENCVLNSNDAEHCVWTWGVKNVSFTDCDFFYSDRAVNCYGENVTTNASFTDCTFTKVAGKDTSGAIETNSSALTALNLTITDCSVNEGDLWWVSTWDSLNGANTTVNGVNAKN